MQLDHVAFFVSDAAATIRFYEALTGRRPSEHEGGYARFPLDGHDIVIHEAGERTADSPPMESHVAFAVDDLGATVERMVEDGATLVEPPREYPWGMSAYLRAPDGSLVELA